MIKAENFTEEGIGRALRDLIHSHDPSDGLLVGMITGATLKSMEAALGQHPDVFYEFLVSTYSIIYSDPEGNEFLRNLQNDVAP